jgi:uncharacterized damage-inducible protein DinB
MASGLMKDAFGHHTWATLELIDVCESLNESQLSFTAPGTFGSVLATFRHLVGADAFYLSVLAPERAAPIDETSIGLAELRAAVEHQGTTWAWLAASNFDVEGVLEERDDDGYVRRAPVSIRLAQALHHGTDHRSQICTALSALGVTPPDIDVWQFGLRAGSVVELFPPHAD